MDAPFPRDPLLSATDAVQELKDAFAALGITLPSISMDLASCVSDLPVRPLVELGRCNLETARRLAAVLREAAP